MELININDFKKKAKIRYILNLVLVLLLLVVVITGCIFSLVMSPLDYAPYMIINIAISLIAVIAAIFYFANIFPIISHYYRYYKRMSNVGLEHRRRRTFVEELPSKDISKVTYRVLLFSYNEGEKVYKENLYVLDSNYQFKTGSNYKIATYQNVIVKCEDLDDAEVQ